MPKPEQLPRERGACDLVDTIVGDFLADTRVFDSNPDTVDQAHEAATLCTLFERV